MLWLTVAMLALLAVGAVLYNRLVSDRNRVDSAWSDIDVQLQRRHDLVPQLVKAIDQYAGYERATLEAVTVLRREAVSLGGQPDPARRGKSEEALSGGLSQLIALAEQYPDLKANENFLHLQTELSQTENYLQFARRFYNGATRQYNTRIETVPNNVVARLFGFRRREFFQKTADEAANVPLVNFGTIE